MCCCASSALRGAACQLCCWELWFASIQFGFSKNHAFFTVKKAFCCGICPSNLLPSTYFCAVSRWCSAFGDSMADTATGSTASLNPSQFACCICFEMLLDPVVGNCGHDFCKSCIEDWKTLRLRSGLEVQCPVCRTTLLPSGKTTFGVCIRLRDMIDTLFPVEVAARRKDLQARSDEVREEKGVPDPQPEPLVDVETFTAFAETYRELSERAAASTRAQLDAIELGRHSSALAASRHRARLQQDLLSHLLLRSLSTAPPTAGPHTWQEPPCPAQTAARNRHSHSRRPARPAAAADVRHGAMQGAALNSEFHRHAQAMPIGQSSGLLASSRPYAGNMGAVPAPSLQPTWGQQQRASLEDLQRAALLLSVDPFLCSTQPAAFNPAAARFGCLDPPGCNFQQLPNTPRAASSSVAGSRVSYPILVAPSNMVSMPGLWHVWGGWGPLPIHQNIMPMSGMQ